MRFFFFYTLLLFAFQNLHAQDEDVLYVKKIHDEVLMNGKCYEWLSKLCLEAGPRLSGSPAYDKAVEVTSSLLETIPNVELRKQKVEVNYWERGLEEEVYLKTNENKKLKLHALALGNSIGTDGNFLEADVIEVQSLDEVEKLGKDKIQGKIVFYNRPMDASQLNTFRAYGQAADQRVSGPTRAAKYGAVAVMIRSLGFALNNIPHTGACKYADDTHKIPAVAISTKDADMLSDLLKKDVVKAGIKTNCLFRGKKETYNVIGEIKGKDHPEKIILIGGHLDSWDVGQGAHDDGAGCVHSMEVLRTLAALGYQPRHTIRCVLFANEENGLAGGNGYAEKARSNPKEFHTAAIESDAGGFVPRNFSFDADTSVLKAFFKKVNNWLPVFEPYGIQFELGGSGADIGPLKFQKGLLVGLRPDTSRYFDFHHTAIDSIEAVHPRELKLGAAAMASLVYMIDKYFD